MRVQVLPTLPYGNQASSRILFRRLIKSKIRCGKPQGLFLPYIHSLASMLARRYDCVGTMKTESPERNF